jgi:hypothetical protein
VKDKKAIAPIMKKYEGLQERHIPASNDRPKAANLVWKHGLKEQGWNGK